MPNKVDLEKELLELNSQEVAFIKNFKRKLAAADQHTRAMTGIISLIPAKTEKEKERIKRYVEFIENGIQPFFLEEFKGEQLVEQETITTKALVGELNLGIDSLREHLKDISPYAIRDELLFLIADLEEQRTKIYKASHDETLEETSEATLEEINQTVELLFRKLKQNIDLIRGIFEAENISFQKVQTSTIPSELESAKIILQGQNVKFNLLIADLRDQIIKPILGFLQQQRLIMDKILEVSNRKRITKRVVRRDLRSCSSPQEKLEYLNTTILLLDVAHKPKELMYFIYDEMKKAQKELKRVAAEIAIDRERIEREAVMEQDWGIFNRKGYNRFLPQKIREALRNKLKLSLLMIDIDHFKDFNDTFGHSSGDEVLKSVAITIKEKKRAGTEAFRYGGEEFAVLFIGTPKNRAIKGAERIRKAIEKDSRDVMDRIKKVTKREGRNSVTISGGVACLAPTKKMEKISESLVANIAYELKEAADQALYEAKDAGRNNIKPGKIITEIITKD